MSLLNNNFIGFDGTPITGRAPTQLTVYADDGYQMPEELRGAVMHAYKLFCDQVNFSAFPHGYHLRNVNFPDGSKARMESNAGVHRVMVWPVGNGEEDFLPYGLCAYPINCSDAEPPVKTTWHKPVLLDWDEEAGVWVVAKGTIHQVAPIPTPPEFKSISPLYWVDAKGRACVNNGKKSFFGLEKSRVKKHKYDKFAVKKTPDQDKDTAIPFVIDDSAGGFAAPTRIYRGSVVVYETNYLRDYATENGTGKKPNLLFPPAVTQDGKTVALNVAMDHYWVEPSPGFFSKYKYYYSDVVSLSRATEFFPTGVVTKLMDNVASVSGVLWNDGTGELKSEDYLPTTTGFGDLTWEAVTSPGSPPDWHGAVLYCNWPGAANVPLGDLYVVLGGGGGGQTDVTNRRMYDKRDHKVEALATATIGYLTKGTGVEAVALTISNNAELHWKVEGQHRVADRDASVWAAIVAQPGPAMALGDSRKEVKERTVSVSQTANNFVRVSVAGFDVKTYEINSTTNGGAVRRTTLTQNTPWSHETGVDWLAGQGKVMGAGDFGARWWDGVDDTNQAPSSHRGIYYKGAQVTEFDYPSIGAAIAAQPSIISQYESSMAKSEEDADSFPNFVTTLSGTAKGRTIIGCDLDMEFLAYVECSASWNYTTTGTAVNHWISILPSNAPHTVSVKLVVKHRGVEYSKDLISSQVIAKPPKVHRDETTNPTNWPRGPADPDYGLYIYANDLGLTSVPTLVGVDGVFKAQGSSLDFAGYTKVEEDEYAKGEGGNRLVANHGMIFSKRFNIRESKFDWLFDVLLISESKRGVLTPTEAEARAYYYSDDLYNKIAKTNYLVELDHTGLKVWPEVIPPRDGCSVNPPPNRDAICFRV